MLPSNLEEYEFELTALAGELDMIKDTVATCTKREKAIKERINDIADTVGGPGTRQVFPLPECGLEFDRRIQTGGEELDLDKLSEELGEERFKELLTIEYTVNEFSMDRLNAARMSGDISDELITKCTTPKTYAPRVYLNKLKD